MLKSMPKSATTQAKVNPFLAVGRRRDDGYHSLVTVFHSVGLFERVRIARSDSGEDSLEFGGGVDCRSLSTGADNLVWQAVDAVAARLGSGRPALTISVEKNTPIQGGMAGGSADAAAALLAANALLGTRLTGPELSEIAASLGSDVPFCLGGGTMVGEGRGERLRRVASVRLSWVIVVDDGALSTPAVYARLDALRAERAVPAPADPSPLLSALASGDIDGIAAGLRNDLQAAAISLAPRLGDTLEAGLAAGARAGLVSGSGPSVALLCLDPAHAARVAEALRAEGRLAMSVEGGRPGPGLDLGERT